MRAQTLDSEPIGPKLEGGDRLGRLDEETLEALEGYQLLRTDVNGWIEVSKDGERMWVEVERE